MRPQPDRVDLVFALVVDPRFDDIFGKHIAAQQKVVIGLQGVERLVEGAGRFGHAGQLFGRQVVYVLIQGIAGADLVIYDSTYTDEEFPRYVSWGHSTWQEGIRLADAAGVKRLVIFHHDPGHDDAFMDRIAEAAKAARPGTLVAAEGMTLSP